MSIFNYLGLSKINELEKRANELEKRINELEKRISNIHYYSDVQQSNSHKEVYYDKI